MKLRDFPGKRNRPLVTRYLCLTLSACLLAHFFLFLSQPFAEICLLHGNRREAMKYVDPRAGSNSTCPWSKYRRSYLTLGLVVSEQTQLTTPPSVCNLDVTLVTGYTCLITLPVLAMYTAVQGV